MDSIQTQFGALFFQLDYEQGIEANGDIMNALAELLDDAEGTIDSMDCDKTAALKWLSKMDRAYEQACGNFGFPI